MGLPSERNSPENQQEPADVVGREPSYPDRARIDSDVRALLRPTSSPWIVFDRDSRIDGMARSALRVGAVFASSPSFREDALVSLPVEAPVPLLGPMTVAMTEKPLPATDVEIDSAASAPVAREEFAPTPPSEAAFALDESILRRERREPPARVPSDPFAVPGLVPKRSRAMMVAGAFAGVLTLIGITSLAVARPSRTLTVKPAATQANDTPASMAPPPPTVEPSPIVSALPAAAPVANAAEVDAAARTSNDPKKRFGKLTIKADGKTKTVWFDGKRMLGTGTRTFLVFCGMHTVAVNEKSDAKDIEVPCNGEFVAQAK